MIISWREGILCLLIAGLIAVAIELFRWTRHNEESRWKIVLCYVGFGISILLAAVCVVMIVRGRTQTIDSTDSIDSIAPIRSRRPLSSFRSVVAAEPDGNVGNVDNGKTFRSSRSFRSVFSVQPVRSAALPTEILLPLEPTRMVVQSNLLLRNHPDSYAPSDPNKRVQANDVVTLLDDHQANVAGNAWFARIVTKEGHTGYVPQSYLEGVFSRADRYTRPLDLHAFQSIAFTEEAPQRSRGTRFDLIQTMSPDNGQVNFIGSELVHGYQKAEWFQHGVKHTGYILLAESS